MELVEPFVEDATAPTREEEGDEEEDVEMETLIIFVSSSSVENDEEARCRINKGSTETACFYWIWS